MCKKKIANSLWSFRKKQGLPQKRVSFFLGHKASSQLSHYERGRKLPGLMNALRLEIIYQVPVASLFADLYQALQEEIRAREARLKKLLETE